MKKFLSLSFGLVNFLWAKKFLVGVLSLGAIILVLQLFIYQKEDEVFRRLLLLSGAIEAFNFLVGFIFYFIKEEILAYFFWLIALSIAAVSIYYVKFVVFSMI